MSVLQGGPPVQPLGVAEDVAVPQLPQYDRTARPDQGGGCTGVVIVQWPCRCAECQRPVLPGFTGWWSGLAMVHTICQPFRLARLARRTPPKPSPIDDYWMNYKEEA